VSGLTFAREVFSVRRMDSVRPLRAALAAFSLACVIGCGAGASRDAGSGSSADAGRVPVTEAVRDTGSDPMIVALEQAFTARNPRASSVLIIEFRREGLGGGANFVLARGVKPDELFEGRVEDELFGVFVFDDSLRRIRQTVAMFPTPRWNETRMRFERTSAESIFLMGWASTSGETLMTPGFRWGATAGP
jgi:hypothetical protein